MATTHLHPGPLTGLLLQGLAQNWWMMLLRGVVAMLFGVLAFMWPGATLLALTFLWGAYALADGVLSLWAAISGRGAASPRWWLAIVGIAGVIAGGLTFFWPGMTALVLLTFIAVWSIIVGVMQIVGAIRLRKEIEGEWLLVLSGLVSIAFGVVMISQPLAGAIAVVWLLGSFAIALGVIYVALALQLRKYKPAA
jgi:uncharacterized membrane protein HdeD (DUF308 family)